MKSLDEFLNERGGRKSPDTTGRGPAQLWLAEHPGLVEQLRAHPEVGLHRAHRWLTEEHNYQWSKSSLQAFLHDLKNGETLA